MLHNTTNVPVVWIWEGTILSGGRGRRRALRPGSLDCGTISQHGPQPSSSNNHLLHK